jgi:hypothetical protein
MSLARSKPGGHFTGLWCLVLLLPWGIAAADELQGDIRLQPARHDVSWVGQELELNLELWSNGLSFGDQLFVLPEVMGGYLMQADSSTVKLNETRENVPWQGLRYTLLFYPQRAGRLEVPSFEVQFTARAGFGTEPARFRHRTPGLFVEARLPPGVDSGKLLVTTRSFSMEAEWTPAVASDGPLELKVGDSLRLEVTRQAQDVPGMVFAPLPVFSIEGLAAYPDPPKVDDRINRGSLTGKRTDGITFICERAGRYTLPMLKFQWWDPSTEVLSEKIIPSLELAVADNPAYRTESAVAENTGSVPDWRFLLAGAASLAVLVYLLRRAWPYLDPASLQAKMAGLRAFLTRLLRRWIKAPVGLPPLNPLPIREKK